MNEFDSENIILEWLRRIPKSKVCILCEDAGSKAIYESLVDRAYNWIDNSSKNALPPDYLNPTESFMMEIMRVNDNDSEVNKKESGMQHELYDNGIMKMFPDVEHIVCSPDVHSQSYENYLKSFKKTVEKHSSKASVYRANYPQINKIAFLVCDESEAYYERCAATKDGILAKPHIWFWDSAFMEILKGTSIDIVIWYTPFKAWERDGIDLPDVVVINPRLIDSRKLKQFNKDHMVDATRVQRIK